MAELSLAIQQIGVDPALQPRVDGVDLGQVRTLEAVVDAWTPLKVVRRGTGFLLVDGFHRFAADGDLHALAFALNAAHGRPLTLSDRRAFAARLLQAHPDWSDREVGRRAGLVQPTIAKVRQELEREQAIGPADTRTGRDGRSYPAKQRPAGASTDCASLLEAVERLVTPADRVAQRTLVRYLQRVAEVLEEQDRLERFETIQDAARACQVFLGTPAAKELASRLGWWARNIVQIAEALGDIESAS
jgi:hypothetical protein